MRWLFVFLLLGMVTSSVCWGDSRLADAKKFESEGNYAEAYDLYHDLLLEKAFSGKKAANIVPSSVHMLNRLNRVNEIDALLEKLSDLYADDWRVLGALANSYQSLSHHGFIVAGEFERGNHRGGGRYASAQARDRVQALQLFSSARDLIREQSETGADPAQLLLQFADVLKSTEVWRLQLLTDFSELPDYEEGNRWGYRHGYTSSRAPADKTGNPVYFSLPTSFADAKNDGERWRALLAEAEDTNPSLAPLVLRKRADFAYQLFGVQTLQEYSWFFQRMPSSEDTLSAAYALDTLASGETIARLASGVKRFPLPDDWQYISMYEELADMDTSEAPYALNQLASIHENRRQYPAAAEWIRTLLDEHGDLRNEPRKKRLEQIVGNQAQFEDAPVFPAGTPVTLEYRFRNGTDVRFKAQRVDMPALLADIRAYLIDNPKQIEHQKVNLHNIGFSILHQDRDKYVGKTVAVWKEELVPLPDHFDKIVSIKTPLQEPGAYLVTADMKDGSTAAQLVWIESTVIVEKPIDNKSLYYVADAVTGEPIPDATIEFFGYRVDYQNNRIPSGRRHDVSTVRIAEKTDKDGLVVFDVSAHNIPENEYRRYQWLISATTPDPQSAPDEVKFDRFAFLNFSSWWKRSMQEHGQPTNVRLYGVTDRPVYRPEHSVHFRAWVRRVRYDLPDDTSEFAGREYTVRIRNPRNEEVYKDTLTADEFAGFGATWEIPEDGTLGVYRIEVVGHGHVGTFRVEEYKSPEFEVKVEAPDKAQTLGEKIEATVKADYLFGAPVTEATVKIKVTRSAANTDFYPVGRWDWLYGPGYLWLTCDAPWHPGWRDWGLGRPYPIWWPQRQDPPEVVAESEQPIGPDGTVTLTIDTALAKAMHGDQDHRYSITAEVTDASRRTIVGSGSVLVARDPFRVFVQLDRGHLRPGEASDVTVHVRRPDGQPQTGEGEAKLYRLTYPDGELEEELIKTWPINIDAEGTAELRIRPERSGQYRISAEVAADGAQQEGAVIFPVAGPTPSDTDFRFQELELTFDKAEYAPGENVRLRINTKPEKSTVLLFIRPLRGVYPMPEVLRIEGHTHEVEIPVTLADMPNFFVEAVTVQDARVYDEARQVALPPESRALHVELEPSTESLLPGEEVQVQVRVTDDEGNPVQAATALAVYDRAIEYISGGSNIPAILEHFWSWKQHHTPQTKHNVGQYSPNIVPPKMVAWRAIGVFGHIADRDDDSLGEEGDERELGAARRMKSGTVMAGMAVDGPMPMMAMAAPMEESSDMVADMESNSGGEAPAQAEPTLRSEFADTAFWSGVLKTDSNGIAEVSFTMPDNLTSWRVKSWVMGHGTRVGEQSSTIVTTKNLLLRMQAPRFFVEKDEVTLSANIHNYFDEDKKVEAILELDGDALSFLDEATRHVVVPAGGEVRVDWRVKAMAEGEAVVRMQALSDEESDAMQLTYPVYVHGMLKTESFSGVVRPDAGEQTVTLQVPAERRPDESRLEVRYSPTLAGAMVDALPYLVSFPYGCTEQTLNRFLPTVITQRILKDSGLSLADIREKRTNLNAQEIGDDEERAKQWKRRSNDEPVFDEARVEEMVREGVQRLSSMQNSDGGWGWFSGYGERSYAHTTVVVVRGLLVARENGAAIVPGIIENGLAWLRRYENEQLERLQSEPGSPHHKRYADNMDANVHMTLVKGEIHNKTMSLRLYKDRNHLSVYGKCMLGITLHAVDMPEELDMVIQNIEQYLVQDEENQTAWLRMENGGYWWYWYGNEFEAHAFYLKLLAATDPQSTKASGLVKYLLNNRKHATYWSSTRDTALCVEAMADYLRASEEDQPDMKVEILLNDKVVKSEHITAENLFSFDNKFVLEGDAVTTGEHQLTVRRTGKGPVYFNAYLTNFTLEDPIKAAGLEVKVNRKVYRLIRDDREAHVSGSHGQAVKQREERYKRILLEDGAEVTSGDLIEVELEVESKNDYEYIVMTDYKAAGFEAVEQRSGYLPNDMGAYVELRDNRVAFFVRQLARGRHSVSYRLRAEVPGKYSALPAKISAMYAPELRGNSDEIKLGVVDEEQ